MFDLASIFQILIFLTFLILITIIAYYKWSFTYWERKKVAHIQPTIPFGNIPSPFNRKQHFGDTINDIYLELKEKGEKYFGIYVFASPSLVPICPEYVRLFTTKEFQSFPNRNLYYNEKDDPISAHLLSLNGEKWRILRTKLTPAFSAAKIKIMFKIFCECAENLVDIMKLKETNNNNNNNNQMKCTIDIKNLISTFTSDVIASCAFGLEINTMKNSNSDFYEYGSKALDFNNWRGSVLFLSSMFPNLARKFGIRQVQKDCADFFMNIVKKTVQHREQTNFQRKDFLQILIDIKNSDLSENHIFTIEELAAQCFIFFLAGYETSATTIAFALYEIANNPIIGNNIRKEISLVLEKYQNTELNYDVVMEMKYLHQVVEETLRKYPPSYYVTRVCVTDFKMPDSDVIVEKGTQITIPISALHSDPEHYPEPEKFDPERFSDENRTKIKRYTYLPFGEGPRNCIGMRFGITQSKVALIHLLTNYHFTVNPRTKLPLKMKPCNLLLEVDGGLWLDYEKLER